MKRRLHIPPRLAPLLAAGALTACGEQVKGAEAGAEEKKPPALLQFEGYAYVAVDATDSTILRRVRNETISAFTGLRKARVMASRREVDNIDVASFKKEIVTVVDTATGARKLGTRVRFRYVARPEIAPSDKPQIELPLALLQRDEGLDLQRVLHECTASTAFERGYESSIGLIFDASLPSCKAAMAAEQAAIDASRAKIPATPAGSPDDSIIPREEFDRLYVPIKATLERRPRSRGEVAPRYESPDRPPAPPTPEAESAEAEREVAPAKVIVDPDMAAHEHAREEPDDRLGGAPEVAAMRVPSKGERLDTARVPEVVAPVAASQHKVDPQYDRFEFSWDTLADPKFIVVWMSLLMVYPILRSESQKKKDNG